VGSAVFPPVGQQPPAAAGQVQTPYQPTPAPSPYGTPPPTTPGPVPSPAPAYGYPQQAGYQAPTVGYGPQGASTPPPYNLTPQTSVQSSGGGGGKSNKPVIIGSIVVSLVAVVGLIVALTLNNNGGEDDKGDNTASPSASTHGSGYRGPDTTKTVETTDCTEPVESYNDPKKVELPDFRYKYIKSVKDCARAAGWQVTTVEVDENTYGEGAIIDQFPKPGTDVDPKKVEIQLNVSTGNPS
jgi:hypothetical protein